MKNAFLRLLKLASLKVAEVSTPMITYRQLHEARCGTNACCPAEVPGYGKPVVILGSGSSLLSLSETDKEYLRNNAFTVALNRYILFWEIIDFFPNAWICADYPGGSASVFDLTMRKLAQQQRELFVFAEREFASHLPRDTRSLLFWRGDPMADQWAGGFNEPLFAFRSTLSIALNLLGILRISSHIKLLGVDLDGSPCFFADDSKALALNFSRDQRLPRKDRHRTSQTCGRLAPIQTKIPFMLERLAEVGIELSCANPQSLLVREGHLPFKPLTST